MSDYDDLRNLQLEEENKRFVVVNDDHYRLDIPEWEMTFDVDRLRWERKQLFGELTVRTRMPGAGTVKDNILAISDMNMSSARAKEDKARYLIRRMKTADEIPWLKLLEEFSINVISADRKGTPGVALEDVAEPEPARLFDVEGFRLPKKHPAILFGDGGSAKSYLALYYIGRLALDGLKVAFFDWELSEEEHRGRLSLLFGPKMPHIHYVRCDRTIDAELDRLSRAVSDEKTEYAVFDSIAAACDGPPESAETAMKYLRATRRLGKIGTLHVAHVSKAEGADKKPFGSSFWHNGARSTWFAKRTSESQKDRAVELGLFHRKANLGPLEKPVGLEFSFGSNYTTVQKTDISEIPEFAESMTVRQRMDSVLSAGSMTVKALSDEIDTPADTIRRTAKRNPNKFILLDGGYVGRRQ